MGAGGAGGRDAGRRPDTGGRGVDAGRRPDARPDMGRADRPPARDGRAADRPPGARFVCPAGPYNSPVVGQAASVCAGFQFNYSYNEGPTWLAEQGAFYFTNFIQGAPMRGDIIKYTPGGACEIFQRDVGCNGLAVGQDGALLAACHQSRSVVRFDPVTGESRTVAAELMGRMLDTPNDLVVHSNGTIYFTNPPFELGGRPPGVGAGVFRIDPAGVVSRFFQGGPPNGIALSPDESQLYALGGGTWDLDAYGVPGTRRGLFTGGDGMAVDCAGNLYARGTIFAPQGAQIGRYGAGTNLAFGGPEGRSLLIVGPGQDVRLVQMNLPGLP
jgi:gluconolactonase